MQSTHRLQQHTENNTTLTHRLPTHSLSITMSSRTPPQSPPSFNVTPQEILDETQLIITSTTQLEDQLAQQLTPSTATFENLLLPILHEDHRSARRLLIFRIFSSVAESAPLRDASRKAEQMIAKAGAASLMRQDIAALVAAVHERHRSELGDEAAYTLFKTHRAYQNAGAGIEDEDLRQRYMDAVEERNAVLVAARKTLSETDEGVWFRRDELDGVPAGVLDTLQKSEDGETLRVTFKRGHLFPVMKHATNAKSRKRLHLAKENRFPENVDRLERLVVLRDDIARMLGFSTHAALKMEDKMAPDVQTVMQRLTDLKTKLKALSLREIETLLDLKKGRSTQSEEDEDDAARLNPWDWAFYNRILEKERYSVDSLLISEYFEVEHSLKGMLRIFEKLFGMEFVPVEAPVWQKDVVVYSAWDAESQGGGFLGYLYLDLYARDGKYSGAHCSLIQPVRSLTLRSLLVSLTRGRALHKKTARDTTHPHPSSAASSAPPTPPPSSNTLSSKPCSTSSATPSTNSSRARTTTTAARATLSRSPASCSRTGSGCPRS